MINEIQRFISQVAAGGHLSREESSRAFQIVLAGGATPAQIAAFLTALSLKGETIEEITGAAFTLRAKMEKLEGVPGAIDVCGTGGDGKGSLNISTAVALVVAGAGVPVVKHGNKSVSSLSGSADVLAALGVNIQASAASSQEALEQAHICFLFAPLYHKAMRHVMPVRQELGMRTIFNLLGPLINPASPKRQLMGVYDEGLIEPMARVLQELGSEAAWVVHGEDGLDELSSSGVTHVAALKDGAITRFTVTPEEAGLERSDLTLIGGGKPEQNARELSLLLAGKLSAYRDAALLNAAAALVIAEKAKDLKEGAMLAASAIDEGRAREALAELARITGGAA